MSDGSAKISDEDFFSELRVDLESTGKRPYEFHFLGASRTDLDGNQDPRTFNPFEDIGDARSRGTAGFLYEAHVDLNNPLSFVKQLRMGRQSGTRDEAVFFDGIAADVRAASKLSFTVYGGAAAHFFELNHDAGSDTLAGIGADFIPGPSSTISLDYLSVKDERTPSSESDNDSLASIRVWHRFTADHRAAVKYSTVNGDPREASLKLLNAFPAAQADLNLQYSRQFRIQNELANEFSPFFGVFGQSQPYQTYDVKARKIFGSVFALDLGYFQRALVSAQQEDAFNREYKRTFATAELLDLFTPGLSLSATGEAWDAGQRKFTSSGADLTYAPPKLRKARFSAGSYFSLYKYDYYLLPNERQSVRAYYVNARAPLGKGLVATAAYELEAGPEDYQTVRLGLRYDF